MEEMTTPRSNFPKGRSSMSQISISNEAPGLSISTFLTVTSRVGRRSSRETQFPRVCVMPGETNERLSKVVIAGKFLGLAIVSIFVDDR